MTTETLAFLRSKFDNICLIGIIVSFICLLTWVDKHGNGDYEKWLEVFIAGFGGAYLGLIKGDRVPFPPNVNGSYSVKTTDTTVSPTTPAQAPEVK